MRARLLGVAALLGSLATPAHAGALAPADEPEAVAFDLMRPWRPARNHIGGRGKARLNEVGRTTGGRRRPPEHRGQ